MKRVVGRPNVLRENGFHVRTGENVDIQADGSLAAADQRRVLWLSPGGTLSAAAVANADFLGWAFNQGDQRPTAINPRVLTEYTLEFVRLFHSGVRRLHPGRWNLWLSVVGFDRDGGVVLIPEIGGGDMAQFWRGVHKQRGPGQPTLHRAIESTGVAGSDAYRLLCEFYAAFGSPPDGIPFVENKSISEARLLAEMGQ
jgi:hypothetical protein